MDDDIQDPQDSSTQDDSVFQPLEASVSKGQGALGAAASSGAGGAGGAGGIGALHQLAYGNSGGPPGMDQIPSILDKMLPRGGPPHTDEDDENTAFWGGITDPKGNPGQNLAIGVGAGLRAQLGERDEREKLRAAYMPLIMQQIMHGQQMTLAAAQATRAWQKDLNPEYMKWMSGLRTGNNVPSRQEAVMHLAKWADMNGLPPNMFNAYAAQIPGDPKEMQKYLDGLILSQKPEAALPSVGDNSAGQKVASNPVLGTQSVLNSGGGGGGAAAPSGTPGAGPGIADGPALGSANPTKQSVEWMTQAAGDPKKFGEGLQNEVAQWQGLMTRMNTQAELGQNFSTGKYGKGMSGVAAAVKDVSSRLGIAPEKLQPVVSALLNAPVGSKDALAAQQVYDQLTQQDVLKQLASSMDGMQGRMNMREYMAFQKAFQGSTLDPEAFNIMRNVVARRYSDSVNKQDAWSKYIADPGQPHSVPHFSSQYDQQFAAPQLQGKDQPMPGAVAPAPVLTNNLPTAEGNSQRLGNGPAQAKGAAPTRKQSASPANQTLPAPVGSSDSLSNYEPGAFLSPQGRAIVRRGGKLYYAKKAK